MGQQAVRVTEPRHAFGRAGEQAAAAWYARRGVRLLASNVRNAAGEIDLVLETREGVIVFCEVKARTGAGGEGVLEALLAVDRTRQRRLARAAACFLAERALEDRLCRFDVVAVGRGPDATAEVLHHVPCAFWCDR